MLEIYTRASAVDDRKLAASERQLRQFLNLVDWHAQAASLGTFSP